MKFDILSQPVLFQLIECKAKYHVTFLAALRPHHMLSEFISHSIR